MKFITPIAMLLIGFIAGVYAGVSLYEEEVPEEYRELENITKRYPFVFILGRESKEDGGH